MPHFFDRPRSMPSAHDHSRGSGGRLRRLYRLGVGLLPVLIVFGLAGCAPDAAAPESVTETTVAPSITGGEPVEEMNVASVSVEIGVGSPIPVDAFISAELPNICSQLARVTHEYSDFNFVITLFATTSGDEACLGDTLPFRIAVPLNMVSLEPGTYTVHANGATTTFDWPADR